MTILMGALTIQPAFLPTQSGRHSAVGFVVDSRGLDSVLSPGTSVAQGACEIWLVTDASDCYIRVAATAVGNSIADDSWYDTASVDQGDPGNVGTSGTVVYQLNERPDSVNIYNAADNTVVGTPTFGNVTGGTAYTSDDKSTFFNPTDALKYGRKVDSDAVQSGFGVKTTDGNFDIQFTFRKAGYKDLTITFNGDGYARAEVDI